MRFAMPIDFVEALRRLAFAAALLFSVQPCHSLTIDSDTIWKGRVELAEDVRVVAGVTLTIEAGAELLFSAALSTKTEPHQWNPDTELSVEGTLKVVGTVDKPVSFSSPDGSWGGLIAAPGSMVSIANAELRDADEAITALEAYLRLETVEIEGSGYGLVLGPGTILNTAGVNIERCEVGVVDLKSGEEGLEGVAISLASDADKLAFRGLSAPSEGAENKTLKGQPGRELIGEYTVEGEERWGGDVTISGRVTVTPGSILHLEPGTRVGFRRVDSNDDGLGEGELLVLGSIRSLGSEEAPVIFESAEASPRAGDWDKVSIISSENPDNAFTHTIFRHGIQALHAHFSSFSVSDSLFEDNLRGVQFQESERAEIRNNRFIGNKQAVRMRDSTVVIGGNTFTANLFAIHGFRCQVTFADNSVSDTVLGGMLVKETELTMRANRFERNRFALRVKGEGSKSELHDNTLLESAESAASFNEATVELRGNTFDRAGLDLIGINGGEVLLRGNLLGQSWRDAIHLNGPAKVDARENTWRGADPGMRIHDAQDEEGLGEVLR